MLQWQLTGDSPRLYSSTTTQELFALHYLLGQNTAWNGQVLLLLSRYRLQSQPLLRVLQFLQKSLHLVQQLNRQVHLQLRSELLQTDSKAYLRRHKVSSCRFGRYLGRNRIKVWRLHTKPTLCLEFGRRKW